VARRLAQTQGTLRFSLDEWVMQLFGTEAPHPMVFEWWVERCSRCSKRIWSVCRDVLGQGFDVVLDFGFPGLAHREEYRALAAEAGATVHLHIVDADVALLHSDLEIWLALADTVRAQSDPLAAFDELTVALGKVRYRRTFPDALCVLNGNIVHRPR
jgi:predicted kinase